LRRPHGSANGAIIAPSTNQRIDYFSVTSSPDALQRSQHGVSLSCFALLKYRIGLPGLGLTQSTPSRKQLKQTVKFLLEFRTRSVKLLIDPHRKAPQNISSRPSPLHTQHRPLRKIVTSLLRNPGPVHSNRGLSDTMVNHAGAP
jgi:hypothetical protein